MARTKTSTKKVEDKSSVYSNYVDRLEKQVESNQSRLSMVLGALIVLVVGILVFNYFNRDRSQDLGPSQKTEVSEDVSAENLPGKYTVKEGDTLFLIAQKYYNDGYKYTEIAKANNITNPNRIEKDQVLEIPKLASQTSLQPETTPLEQATNALPGSKGAPDATMTQQSWGEPITGNSYTVVKGDWLSKVAGRAYGNIMEYEKIAKANNISNPNLIEVGMVLTIPR